MTCTDHPAVGDSFLAERSRYGVAVWCETRPNHAADMGAHASPSHTLLPNGSTCDTWDWDMSAAVATAACAVWTAHIHRARDDAECGWRPVELVDTAGRL